MMNSKTWTATGRPVGSRRRSTIVMLATGLWQLLGVGYQRAQQRHRLLSLSDHQLRDIGLHRWEVELEVKKPFWRQ
jgi:uncharacterized protein YjiS (DUF1127 family)